MTFRYPVDDIVLNRLEEFPKIASKLQHNLRDKSKSKLEIVRILNNQHKSHSKKLLDFIEKHLDSTGEIGVSILNEADPLKFSQRLSEFYLLVSLQSCEGINAIPFPIPRSNTGPNPDINIETETARVKVEVYSPIDVYGFKLVGLYPKYIFRYSECPRGFFVTLELIASDQTGYHAHAIPREHKELENWIQTLKTDVDHWIGDFEAGDSKEFDGLSNAFKIKAKVKKVFDNFEMRCVEYSQPGRSNDVRLFFEGSPENNAENQMGNKIAEKLKKRQCGPPNPEYLRVIVLNFKLADYSYSDWLSFPSIASSLDKTIRVLVERAGDPLPYDIAIPAMLDYNCCFGESIILNTARETEIKQFVIEAKFDQKCQIRVEAPPHELIKALQGCL